MELKDFKVGMRVVAIDKCDGKDLRGKTGTVRIIGSTGNCPIGVEFDEDFDGGHTFCGRLMSGSERGRWCECDSLLPLDKMRFEIEADGAETTVRGYINGREISEKARCAAGDTPNAYVGALMALNKAFGVHIGLAKNGENVIVINAMEPHNNYSVGDIVRMESDVEGTNTKNDTPVILFAAEYAIIDDSSILTKPGKTRKAVCVSVDKSGSPFVVGNVYAVDPDNTISVAGCKSHVVNSPREYMFAEGKNRFIVVNEDGKDAN